MALAMLAETRLAVAQSAAVFDDFDYQTTAWVDDDGLDPSRNAGSLFGWNAWARSADGATPPEADRLWYRGFGWWEPAYDQPDHVAIVDADTVAGVERGGLLLLAPAGYTVPERGRAGAEVLSGFTARHGSWAARINFSDLDDVRALKQSFWTISNYVAIVRRPDGTLGKAWSETDHELNNWFHTVWKSAGRSAPTIAERYVSDEGSVFDGTGFIEGGRNQAVPMRGPEEPGGRSLPPYHCKLVRNGDEIYSLAPASCADLITGTHPRMVYGIPVLDRDIAVDLLIRHDGTAIAFELQANWIATSPDGTSTDTYRLLMASAPYAPTSPADAGIPSQRMTARFSQLGSTAIRQDVNFGERPLLRDHPMVVDWFYYSPDASLTLDDIADHVAQIRASGIPRLNTLGRSLSQPYTEPGDVATWPYLRAEHPAAVILDGPPHADANATLPIVGHYADRHGEVRLVWRTREGDGRGAFSDWRVLQEDAWFRHDVTFPDAETPVFEVELHAGEYPIWGDWTQPPTSYVGHVLTYAWDVDARRFALTGER